MNNDHNTPNEHQNQQNTQYGYQYGNAGQPGQNPYGAYGQGNPYGQNPYGQNPYGQYPYGQYPYGYPQQPVTNNNAKNCFTMGLLSVVFIFLMQILSIVFGALALNYAKKAQNEMGYECPDVKNGRLMGLIGLIVGSIITGIVIFVILLEIILLVFLI